MSLGSFGHGRQKGFCGFGVGALRVNAPPARSEQVQTFFFGIEEGVRRIADFKRNAKLLQVRIHPVALMQKCRLAACEGRYLIVVAAVLQNVFVGVFKQKLQVFRVLVEAFFIQLAFQRHLDNRRIVKSKTAAPIAGQIVLSRDPPHAAGNGGRHRYDRIKTEFRFFRIDKFKSVFIRFAGRQLCGIDAGFLQNIGIVSQAVSFDCNRKTVYLSVLFKCKVGILYPALIA